MSTLKTHIYGIKLVNHQFYDIKNEQKVGMLLQKKNTRGVGISSMMKSIYIPPYNHTH